MRWPGPMSLKTLGEVLAKLFVVMVAMVVFRTREYPWRVEVGAQDADMVLARHHQRYV